MFTVPAANAEADRRNGQMMKILSGISFPLSIIESADLPKDQPLFLYCFRGSRSKRAADILARKGYTQVKSIGGIASYRGTIVSGK